MTKNRIAALLLLVGVASLSRIAEARYYDGEVAVWLQPDRHGMPDGPNRYEYVRNRPTTATDPTGNLLTEVTSWPLSIVRNDGTVSATAYPSNDIVEILDSLENHHYGFSFWYFYDASIGTGKITRASFRPGGITLGLTGLSPCGVGNDILSVIDLAHIAQFNSSVANQGIFVWREEIAAHELSHAANWAMGDDVANEMACDEQLRAHYLMYGDDVAGAAATWAGCTHPQD